MDLSSDDVHLVVSLYLIKTIVFSADRFLVFIRVRPTLFCKMIRLGPRLAVSLFLSKWCYARFLNLFCSFVVFVVGGVLFVDVSDPRFLF